MNMWIVDLFHRLLCSRRKGRKVELFFWLAPEIEGKPKTTCPPGKMVLLQFYNNYCIYRYYILHHEVVSGFHLPPTQSAIISGG
jgi:hypothetical protein